jgi:phosphate transport system substrate-binding protein
MNFRVMREGGNSGRSMVCAIAWILALTVWGTGCKPKSGAEGGAVIQNKGSDTMVNLAQSWAEAYRKVEPSVEIEVSGGGSGVGIAALIKGTIDLATASRNMKEQEIDQARKSTGREPVDFVVGYDALAIFVHRDNPMEEISFEQLARIFAEHGPITHWSQIGIHLPGPRHDEIVRVSRQSSSGTYEFLRERVLDQNDFKLGSRDMNGSKEVVELVSHVPSAIGYSGMGYGTPQVKMLKVSENPGQPGTAPTVESVLNGTYPIARTLHLYTLGKPEDALKEYVDWIMSDAGQSIVQQTGYVPLPAELRTRLTPDRAGQLVQAPTEDR